MSKQLGNSKLQIILKLKSWTGSFKKCQYHERVNKGKEKKAEEQFWLKGSNIQDNQVEHVIPDWILIGEKNIYKEYLGTFGEIWVIDYTLDNNIMV